MLLVTLVGFARADVPLSSAQTPEMVAEDVDQRLERVTRDLHDTEARLTQVRERADLVKHRMLARGRSYYRLTRAGLLPLGSGFEKLIDHTSKVERLRRSLERDATQAKVLAKEHVVLLDRKDKLIARKMPLEVQRAAMAQARAALMEAGDRKRAFDRAFSSSVGPDYVAIYGADPGDQLAGRDSIASASLGFAALLGRLPFPLAGRAEVRTVHRPGAGGPGLELLASVGTPVRSVASGRVAFADEYGEYGRVVILDHGERYFTVSGNMGGVDVRVGEEVGGGARLGTVGSVDGKGLLYFEIRRGADTLDPTPWMGL
jgi:septal ring factor EnvC (AmiA/AmiB activator)